MNKTAVVTGGTKGIGREIVEHLLKLNYRVVYSARSQPQQPLGSEQQSKFVAADARKRESHFQLVKTAVDWTGRLDLYVNNAGYSQWKELAEIDEDFWTMMVETNLSSTFWGTQAAAQHLGPGGSVVNISSLAGRRGSANNSAYCAAKFGVTGLTQALSKELGVKGIRVNAVCPVYILTDSLEQSLKETVAPAGGKDVASYLKDFANSQAALKRLPTGNEVARAVAFLASEEASAITGQSMNVDCGVMPL